MSPGSAGDPLGDALEAVRDLLAPPPLGRLDGGVMLAVASVPGKIPEEWRQAGPLWMAHPHADGACIHAVEMTAAQLRARLDGMGGRG